MKIGIEAQRLFRLKKYGMDVVALELIRHLQMIDTQNEYYILVRSDIDRECITASKNVHIVEIPAYNYPHWEQIKLPDVVEKLGLDILHCTANTAPLFVKIPLILTLHDVIFMENKFLAEKASRYQRLGNIYRKMLLPWVVKKCKRIVTVSKDERKTIIERLKINPEKINVVYNGVSETFALSLSVETKARAKIKYRLPDNYLLFLGNTDPKKNVANVIHAFTIFAPKEPDVKMVIADLSPETVKDYLLHLGKSELFDRFVFTGYIPRFDIPSVYAQANIFLYPSLRESFGLPILEAMACGVPVITSNVAALPEVGGDAVVLVDPTQPQTIADAIDKLYYDANLREQKIAAGYKNFPRFNWTDSAYQMLSIYREVYKDQKINSES
jgi:glycosyltransferase involved in cell wall biosynthesis